MMDLNQPKSMHCYDVHWYSYLKIWWRFRHPTRQQADRFLQGTEIFWQRIRDRKFEESIDPNAARFVRWAQQYVQRKVKN